MPKIKLKNLSLFYELAGSGETLVLISGFGNDHTIWDKVIPLFRQHYQVLVLDNRGSGQSSVPQGAYTIDEMADDVIALCNALHIGKAHFIGNSMGGFICQNIAYRYPEKVKTTTIANASTTTHNCFLVYVKAQLALLKAGVPLKALIQASCSWAFSYQYLSKPGVLGTLIHRTLTQPHPFTIDGYKGQFAAVNAFDSRSWVQQIAVPVLVLSADQDRIFLEATIKDLAHQIPNAEYYCFENCGHIPQIEYPQEFFAVVDGFIKRNMRI